MRIRAIDHANAEEEKTKVVSSAFITRVERELLPQFCDDPTRGWGSDGFERDWSKVTDVDAEGFLRGLDAGLIIHIGRGLYRAPMSQASEQFFWSGRVNTSPRKFWLWVEPIITVVTLSRLHFEFGWPKKLIGAQSKEWGFDATAHLAAAEPNEFIACEIKKSSRELTRLLDLMRHFGMSNPPHEPEKKSEINAYRKLKGLRARRASVFWAIGPGGVGSVHRVDYKEDGVILLKETCIKDLYYPGL